jgi:hypothetical protein
VGICCSTGFADFINPTGWNCSWVTIVLFVEEQKGQSAEESGEKSKKTKEGRRKIKEETGKTAKEAKGH